VGNTVNDELLPAVVRAMLTQTQVVDGWEAAWLRQRVLWNGKEVMEVVVVDGTVTSVHVEPLVQENPHLAEQRAREDQEITELLARMAFEA
jgi:hypothetical protein